MYKSLEKDKNGFYILDGLVPKQTGAYEKAQKFEVNGKHYYFKHDYVSDCEKFSGLAFGFPWFLNEIVNEKVVEQFDLGTVGYHLARVGDDFGVVSSDFAEIYNNTKLAEDVIKASKVNKAKFHTKTHCLKFYNQCREIGEISDTHFEKLQLASLIHFGLLQYDGIAENMAFAFDKDDIILFDHERSLIASCDTKKELKKYINSNDCVLRLGLDFEDERLNNFACNMVANPLISKDILGSYLDVMTNILRGNAIFKSINEQVEDEYRMNIPKDYMKKFSFALKSTTKKLEDVYDKKIEMC
ncbi:MAG: hypothetical protein IJA61_03825 [Clostridia bacterium]|nr:hypothetical protein [Clostridia bacterium]